MAIRTVMVRYYGGASDPVNRGAGPKSTVYARDSLESFQTDGMAGPAGRRAGPPPSAQPRRNPVARAVSRFLRLSLTTFGHPPERFDRAEAIPPRPVRAVRRPRGATDQRRAVERPTGQGASAVARTAARPADTPMPARPAPAPALAPARPSRTAANDDRPGTPGAWAGLRRSGDLADRLGAVRRVDPAALPATLVAAGLAFLPLAASALTACILVAAALALLLRLLGRLPRPTPAERIVGWLAVGFVALGFAVSVSRHDPLAGLRDAFPDLGLLALPLLLPALRGAAASRTDGWRLPVLALVAGAVASFPLVLAEVWLTGNARPELGSGNSLMLSHGAGLTGLLCLVISLRRPPVPRAWLVAGALSAAATLVVAGGRAPLVAFALLALVALVLAPRGARRTAALLLVGLVALGAGGAVGNDTLISRLHLAAAQADAGMERMVEESAHARAVLFEGAIRAWSDAPWLGHGRQHVMDAIEARGASHPTAYLYSHPHNAVLNEAVAGGILLLALYATLLGAPFLLARGRRARHIAAIAIGWFALTGLTNLGFGHDVTVGSFVACVALVAAWPARAPAVSRRRHRRRRDLTLRPPSLAERVMLGRAA